MLFLCLLVMRIVFLHHCCCSCYLLALLLLFVLSHVAVLFVLPFRVAIIACYLCCPCCSCCFLKVLLLLFLGCCCYCCFVVLLFLHFFFRTVIPFVLSLFLCCFSHIVALAPFALLLFLCCHSFSHYFSHIVVRFYCSSSCTVILLAMLLPSHCCSSNDAIPFTLQVPGSPTFVVLLCCHWCFFHVVAILFCLFNMIFHFPLPYASQSVKLRHKLKHQRWILFHFFHFLSLIIFYFGFFFQFILCCFFL